MQVRKVLDTGEVFILNNAEKLTDEEVWVWLDEEPQADHIEIVDSFGKVITGWEKKNATIH